MMMTPGTFQANSKEDLAYKGTGIRRFTFIAKDCCRSIAVCAALGSEQLLHEFIVRLVLTKTLPQPKVEQVNGLYTDARRIASNQVAPLHSPVIGVSRLFQ